MFLIFWWYFLFAAAGLFSLFSDGSDGEEWGSNGYGYGDNACSTNWERKPNGGFSMSIKLSDISSQNCSSIRSGCFSSLLPATIAAFMPPIEVPAIMSIFILLFASPLTTPQPKAPSDPPPCNIKTFSILSLLLCDGEKEGDGDIYLVLISNNGINKAHGLDCFMVDCIIMRYSNCRF